MRIEVKTANGGWVVCWDREPHPAENAYSAGLGQSAMWRGTSVFTDPVEMMNFIGTKLNVGK